VTGRPPLDGLRVVVTRAAHQAAPTVATFAGAGARVRLLPLIEVVPPADPAPLDAALADLGAYRWLIFTSRNTVDRVLDRLGDPPALPAGLAVASVGSATSEALRERGVEPDLEAADPRAEGLAQELLARVGKANGEGRARVLLPQAADARPVLEETLRQAGVEAVRVDAYAKRVPPEAPERAREVFGTEGLGWVTFTSPSIARAFRDLWGDDWPERRRSLLAASIGPVTSDALRALGVEAVTEAETPSDEAMVAAVTRAVARSPRGA